MNEPKKQRAKVKFSILQTDGTRKWYEDTGTIKNCTSHGLFFVRLDNPIDPGTPHSVYEVYVKPENCLILGL